MGWSQDGLSGAMNEKLPGESTLEMDSGVPTELTDELGKGLALDSSLKAEKILGVRNEVRERPYWKHFSLDL